MGIKHEILSDTLVVRPTGLINVQTSPELREVLLTRYPGKGNIVINLSQVTYMDSSGLATLVEGLGIAGRGGGKLVLCEIREKMIEDLLEITHLTGAFAVTDTEAVAVS